MPYHTVDTTNQQAFHLQNKTLFFLFLTDTWTLTQALDLAGLGWDAAGTGTYFKILRQLKAAY